MLRPPEKRGSRLVIVGARAPQEGAVCATDAPGARGDDATGRLPAVPIRTGHLTAAVTVTPLQARDEHRCAEETGPGDRTYPRSHRGHGGEAWTRRL